MHAGKGQKISPVPGGMRSFPFIMMFCFFFRFYVSAEDWPTFKHDIQRTARSSEQVTLPLNLQWVYCVRHAPAPAWPPPARQDIWNVVPNLPALNAFDRAYQVVVANNRLYFGSNADGKVYCLDATNGSEVWSFFTEGPVRFAPSAANGNVYSGSDDGRTYCLNATTGALIWRFAYDSAARRIAGNERIISSLPIRTDVLIRNANCYFGAGVFPSTPGMATWRVVLNATTGAVVSTQSASYVPEGYLVFDGTNILCPTGRLGTQPFAKVAAQLSAVSPFVYNEYDASTITVGSTTFRGDSVRVTGGTWSSPVNGRAYSLAFSNGRLFVSTSSGYIYCFASAAVTKPDTIRQPVVDYPYASTPLKQQYAAAAQRILTASGVTRGYCLVLNSEGGHLAYELAKASNLQIVCVEPDSAKAAAARRQLDSAGVLNQVTVQRWSSGVLPYANMFFNIVTFDGYGAGTAFSGSRSEAKRVLRPYGGMAFFGLNDTYRKGAIIGAGEWTHFYTNTQNNPYCPDQYVSGGSSLRLQWFGQPGPRNRVDRHNRPPAPLWKDGVMFVPGENWLTAVDAYNGAILWDKAISLSSRLPGQSDAGPMAAASDYVYVAADNKCLGFTAREGTAVLTLPLPNFGTSVVYAWGYTAVVDSILFGSAVKNHLNRTATLANDYIAYFDNEPWVVSDYLFALDRYSGTRKWLYTPAAGVIINTSIVIANNRIMFLESSNAAARSSDSCRLPLSTLLGNGTTALVSLNAQSGSQVWRRTVNLSRIVHAIYMLDYSGKLIVAGSYNQGSTLYYEVSAFNEADGNASWPALSISTGLGTNLSHGEQNAHPVVVADRLFMICGDPVGLCVNVATGQRVTWTFNRGGHSCGIASASNTHLYYRGSEPIACNIASNTIDRLAGASAARPGCWINMVPAGGLLNIPEYSSGCTCGYSLQTSLTFLSTAAMPVDSFVTGKGWTGGISAAPPEPAIVLSRGAGIIFIRIDNLPAAEKLTVHVVNAAGRVMFTASAAPKTNVFQWNARHFAGGLYLIAVQTAHHTISRKMLICR